MVDKWKKRSYRYHPGDHGIVGWPNWWINRKRIPLNFRGRDIRPLSWRRLI